MSNAHRLLVVDDDQDLLDTLAEQLALYDEFAITVIRRSNTGYKT